MMAITFGESRRSDGRSVRRQRRRDRVLSELVRHERLGRLRERMFVTAPITYSAYRFVRSLYGNKGYSSW